MTAVTPRWRRHVLTAASPLLLLCAWELMSAQGLLREAFFPRPTTVLRRCVELAIDGTLARHALATIGRLALASLLATVPGVIVGLAMGTSRHARQSLDGLFAVIYPIPMGAAGFNAVAGGLPVEFVAPLHMGYIEDYFTVRKAVWGSQVKRVADLKGHTVALNIRGAAVEWMLEQALRRDGLSIKDVHIKLMPFPDMVPALESGAVDAGIVSEPFPTIAEERGVAVRPLERPAGARPTPITALFWNSEWARSNGELAHKVMLAFARSVRDLAADGGKGWSEERNLQVILKFTSAKPEILRKARPHVVDPNLEMDTAVLASMQKFAADLGYLKYKDPLPVEKLFNFTHRDRAIKELGRK